MAKFFGKIGYSTTVETSPGIWTETIIERPYYGDILKNSRRWQTGESINDDLNFGNRISIVGDPYAYNNFAQMRWVEWMNAKWIVSDVEVEYPRLILSLGGVYNG